MLCDFHIVSFLAFLLRETITSKLFSKRNIKEGRVFLGVVVQNKTHFDQLKIIATPASNWSSRVLPAVKSGSSQAEPSGVNPVQTNGPYCCREKADASHSRCGLSFPLW